METKGIYKIIEDTKGMNYSQINDVINDEILKQEEKSKAKGESMAIAYAESLGRMQAQISTLLVMFHEITKDEQRI